VRRKANRKFTTGPSPKVPISHLRKIPGFLYTAEVSAKDFKPQSCIGGFASLTGFSLQDFLNRDFYNTSVVKQNDFKRLQRFRNSIAHKSKSRGINYHIISNEGKKLSVSEHVILLRNDKRRKLIGGIVTLTEKSGSKRANSRLEKDRLRFEKIEELNKHLIEINQLKDEFLANTSHELRTPLNSIIGFLTLITEGYYDSDDELRLFTRNALDSSYHLLSVINDLLDISRIEAGKVQLQIERVYVDELLREICSLFKVQADQKGLDLECSANSSPLFAAADLRKLRQVLINLTGNAIKFTMNGKVEITAEPQNGNLRFAVKDTGIGIPKEKQEKLFQKFIQIDGSTTRKFGGTGLGLVISKHLVEMMGGKITIESEGLGKGTTMHFTIPRWTKEEE